MSAEESLKRIFEEINEKGRAHLYTKGISMRPLLKEKRDISVLVPPERALRRGDVVLYIRRDQLVLHRIVKVNTDGSFLIRGDNTFSDETVNRDDIKAILEAIYRKGRYIDCEKSFFYRFYSSVWTAIYPIRKFFRIAVRQRLAKFKNSLK